MPFVPERAVRKMPQFLRIKNPRPAISSHWKDFGDLPS